MEEKVYKSNKISLELLKQLKDAEVEIETLKQYVVDLKQRISVYIPVKHDKIDQRLALFINNYPDAQNLRVLFIRHSEGIYSYGSRKVSLKVEKDLLKVRVGGGYLSIEDFVEQYSSNVNTTIDLPSDPSLRLAERVKMNKYIDPANPNMQITIGGTRTKSPSNSR